MRKTLTYTSLKPTLPPFQSIRFLHTQTPQNYSKFFNHPSRVKLENDMNMFKQVIELSKQESHVFTHAYQLTQDKARKTRLKEMIDSCEITTKRSQDIINKIEILFTKSFGRTEDQHEIYQCYQRSQDLESIRNLDCGLIIQSTRDLNKALEFPQPTIAKVNKLGLTPIFREASSAEEIDTIIATLTSNRNRIRAVYFRAHGTPLTMGFGTNNNPTYIMPWNRLLRHSLEMIDSKAVVFLRSCSTGKERLLPCFGRIISYYQPNHTIIAPTIDIKSIEEFTVTEERNRESQIILKTNKDMQPNCVIFRKGRIFNLDSESAQTI